MPAPFHSIKRKAEDAIKARLQALDDGTFTDIPIVKGFELLEDLDTPRVEILAVRARAENFGEEYTGNLMVTVQMAIVSHKNDVTRGEHQTRTAVLSDFVMRDDIEAQLNSAGITDFTVFNPGWNPGGEEDSVLDSEIRTMWDVELYAKPS